MASFAVKQQVHSLLALFTLVCVLLMCAFGGHAQSPAGSLNTPQASLTAFYHWYLDELAKSRDPLHDDRAKIEVYVSRGLLREIEQLSKSAEGLDEDYFSPSTGLPRRLGKQHGRLRREDYRQCRLCNVHARIHEAV
jgi:hypothetical protein